MICFQLLVLRSLNTTLIEFDKYCNSLWFAFNYWYYDLWIQRFIKVFNHYTCCDLLSITGITIFEYNAYSCPVSAESVVICFQLLVLRSLNTTSNFVAYTAQALWFAFNYWYYDLWIQLSRKSLIAISCCDLLSITGITIFEYNQANLLSLGFNVVICFQLLVLRSLNTTASPPMLAARMLWFAFNYWYYDLWIQLNSASLFSPFCCDLLSITGITIFEYNFLYLSMMVYRVVICFQLLVLRSLNTTLLQSQMTLFLLWFAFNYWYYDLWIQRGVGNLEVKHRLWFAFNYWYYDLWIQLKQVFVSALQCCDLLSITGITIFEYNIKRWKSNGRVVVICFQLLVLRSLNTTTFSPIYIPPELWFAFNYWYYDLWIQQDKYRLQLPCRCDLLSITGITIFEYNKI